MCSRIYTTFNYPNFKRGDKTFLTGIRKYCGKYYISGYYLSGTTNISFVYRGDLTGKPNRKNTWNTLSYPNSTTTTLYGPSPIEENYIKVVGNYKTEQTGNRALGVLYQGKLDGSGEWTTLSPSTNTTETIAHSVMGNFVVGNYLEEGSILGEAFIYNISTGTYYNITNGCTKSITAYGIWENFDNYTICGGTTTNKNINMVYLVDWDGKSNMLSNWRFYKYGNDPEVAITHFNGISGKDYSEKYTLTGDYSDGNSLNAFFSKVDNYGSTWETISYPNSLTTSGNSVVDSIVIGVYTLENSDSVNGYVSFKQ